MTEQDPETWSKRFWEGMIEERTKLPSKIGRAKDLRKIMREGIRSKEKILLLKSSRGKFLSKKKRDHIYLI